MMASSLRFGVLVGPQSTAWLARFATIIGLSLTVSSGAICQPLSDDPPALRARMNTFARAREFHDVEVLRQLNSPAYLKLVHDTLAARFRRFQLAYPGSESVPEDGGFRRFIELIVPGADGVSFGAFSDAFKLLERGDSEDHAVLQILALVYRFAPRPWIVTASNVQFGRLDSDKAVYYLSESWTLPLDGTIVPKRFIVEWTRSGTSDGTWLLNRVRQ